MKQVMKTSRVDIGSSGIMGSIKMSGSSIGVVGGESIRDWFETQNQHNKINNNILRQELLME